MLTITIRLILIYLLLICTMRAMGKRQLGQLQLSELVTTILLSELAVQPVTDPSVPLAFAVVPIAVLLSIEVIISFSVTRIPALKPIFDGKPSILVNRGRLDLAEMSRVRISIEEFLSQLRICGIADLDDVEYAVLEQNGQLSVIPRRIRMPPNAEDLSLPVRETGLAHALIVDTQISDFDLKLVGHDRDWLENRLAAHHIPLCDTLLFTVDDSGKESLIRKSCVPSDQPF